MAILASRTRSASSAKPVNLGLPLVVFLVLLAGSLGMVLVLFRLAPSAEAFEYAICSETGVYLTVCCGLSAVGTAFAFRAFRAGRCSKWVMPGIAVSLVLVDGALAAVVSPRQKSLLGLLRYLPVLTPAHVLLLVVVIGSCLAGAQRKDNP